MCMPLAREMKKLYFESLLVMRPHPEDFDGPFFLQDLVDQAMLDVDPAGAGTREVSHELFVVRRVLERIFAEDLQELLGPVFQVS